jgi:hypothetical protein
MSSFERMYGISESILTSIMIGSAVCVVIFYVLCAIFMMKVFQKANQQGWKAWVPIYNSWVLLELGGYKGWIALLMIAGVIPCIGTIAQIVAYVFIIMAAYQIGLKLGKGGGWTVLYIFLPFVWAAILGLSQDQWNDSLGKPALTAERPPTYGATAAYGSPAYDASAYGAPVQQAYQQQPQQPQQPYQQQPQQPQQPQPPYQQ